MKIKYMTIALITLVLLIAILLPACTKETTTTAASKTTTAAAVKTTPAAPVAVKTLKISYSCPKGKGYSAGEEWFGPEFEKRTNGRYKVEIYGMSTLVPVNAVLDSVRTGICQIGLTSTAMFAKDFPLSMVTMNPLTGWPGASEAMYQASNAAWDEFSKIPEVAAELNNGFIYLTNDILIQSVLVMKSKQVRVPADFKGTKVSVTGGLTPLVTGNGGAAVPIVGPDNYENMSKGVIEGGFLGLVMATDWKVSTLADWYYMIDAGCGNMIAIMNKDFYNSMSAEDKQIFEQTRKDMLKPLWDAQIKGYADSQKILADAGKTLTYPTADELKVWKNAVDTIVIPKWKADAMSVGVSAATCDKVLAKWMEIRAKYWKQYNIPGEP